MVAMRMVRRDTLSESCPAGMAKRITGNAWTSPTQPSTRASPVRSNNCHPTATLSICVPSKATIHPIRYSRYPGWRSAA